MSAPAFRGQKSIRSSSISRTSALVGTGAKVGMNYLKHYGKQALSGKTTGRQTLDEANASDVYQTFSSLKGGPLKVAQMLSIDHGLLPAAYVKEFSKAQYSAPPLSYPLVARTFRREFGKDPSALFDTFSREAVHGASIGQVHQATLGKKKFAVKVQYPGVADSLKSDLRVVKLLALQVLGLKERDVAAYFQEIEERLLEETNYKLELRRSQEISAKCGDLANVRFTTYHREFSSAKILTMDWVDGTMLDQFADSSAPQAERDQVGQALWDFYHHQIHRLRLFHADPHPGNFLVKNAELWPLDFGCTKALEPEFYRKQFAFLDPAMVHNRALLEKAMMDLSVILPSDPQPERDRLIDLCGKSIELLARPFHAETFDFGSPVFMRSIYEMGEDNTRDPSLRGMSGARGSADSLYVNRTYFGLYSLLARLRANVRTAESRPEILGAALAV